MLFNSLEFAIFLPIVFLLYWTIMNKNLKLQNIFIVVVSYIFYGWWDERFLLLIAFSSFLDYFIGIALSQTEEQKKRKFLLGVSIFVNLGFLGFFKYFNFFVDSFVHSFTLLGMPIQGTTLNIILPVGISFYTFQTLSYSIDIYRKKLEPTKDIVAFFAFVTFFPQLVAGPIERATHLLPQFYKKRIFDEQIAKDGLHLIIWGLFKKIVIADNCAQYVNDIFDNYQHYSSITLFVGAIAFSFQIYCDFSAYSDIAIGTSKIFGFDLMKNFSYPYFSRDIAEFWRRWHISLSTWFRDYVYIPLGGSKNGKWGTLKNTFIIFIISGFWHGANWTFVIWGLINALYYIPLFLLNRNRKNIGNIEKFFPSFIEIYGIITTFLLVTFAWIFFRANNMSHALTYINKLFSFSFKIDKLEIERYAVEIIPIIFLLVLFEWFSRHKDHPLTKGTSFLTLKTSFIILMILIFGSYSSMQEFIYFQF